MYNNIHDLVQFKEIEYVYFQKLIVWNMIMTNWTFCLQKMKVVAVPTEEYGKFFNGDAYIIYACTEYGKHGGMNMEVLIFL